MLGKECLTERVSENIKETSASNNRIRGNTPRNLGHQGRGNLGIKEAPARKSSPEAVSEPHVLRPGWDLRDIYSDSSFHMCRNGLREGQRLSREVRPIAPFIPL